LLHSVQTGSVAHPHYYTKDTGDFPSRKESGRDVKLTTHLHIEQRSRMVELYLRTSNAFMEWCLIYYAQGQLYFTFI
jgi:hypothetical protein